MQVNEIFLTCIQEALKFLYLIDTYSLWASEFFQFVLLDYKKPEKEDIWNRLYVFCLFIWSGFFIPARYIW